MLEPPPPPPPEMGIPHFLLAYVFKVNGPSPILVQKFCIRAISHVRTHREAILPRGKCSAVKSVLTTRTPDGETDLLLPARSFFVSDAPQTSVQCVAQGVFLCGISCSKLANQLHRVMYDHWCIRRESVLRLHVTPCWDGGTSFDIIALKTPGTGFIADATAFAVRAENDGMVLMYNWEGTIDTQGNYRNEMDVPPLM